MLNNWIHDVLNRVDINLLQANLVHIKHEEIKNKSIVIKNTQKVNFSGYKHEFVNLKLSLILQ